MIAAYRLGSAGARSKLTLIIFERLGDPVMGQELPIAGGR